MEVGWHWSQNCMKKLLTLGLAGAIVSIGVSCTTSYDQYGRASSAVTPGGALLGAAALGAIAYSAGKDRGKYKERHKNYGYRNYGGSRYGRSYWGHYGGSSYGGNCGIGGYASGYGHGGYRRH